MMGTGSGKGMGKGKEKFAFSHCLSEVLLYLPFYLYTYCLINTNQEHCLTVWNRLRTALLLVLLSFRSMQ